MKLTDTQRSYLADLAKLNRPIAWTGPNKAMGNKLVKMGLALYREGYPHGFAITEAGKAALEGGE